MRILCCIVACLGIGCLCPGPTATRPRTYEAKVYLEALRSSQYRYLGQHGHYAPDLESLGFTPGRECPPALAAVLARDGGAVAGCSFVYVGEVSPDAGFAVTAYGVGRNDGLVLRADKSGISNLGLPP